MISFKNYYVATTEGVDFIPIIHDVRFAIQEAKVTDGLVTITLPENEASLWIGTEQPAERLQEKFPETATLQQRSLTLPFQKKELLLSPKEMIYLIDKTDSGKRRQFHVTVQGNGDDKPEKPQRR